MAEEVDIIRISVVDGNLNIRINSMDAVQLWGLAKIIEKRADEIHFQGMMIANQKKPRIIRA
jgi:hypothetical protein